MASLQMLLHTKVVDCLPSIHSILLASSLDDGLTLGFMLVLVRTFWKEGKVDEAVHTVRDMEQRGIKGSASVYYELACCLCNKGRWQEAMMEVSAIRIWRFLLYILLFLR